MEDKQIGFSNLSELFAKYGIQLIDAWDGQYRSITDIIEDMYLKLDSRTLVKLFIEIGEEEAFGNNIFQKERDRWY